MESRSSQALWRMLTTLAIFSCLALAATAQDDPDPNSPTPVLLSEMTSTRALAHSPRKVGRNDLAKVTPQAFEPDSKVTIYVTNLALMNGEGANAFRVYALDKDGRAYQFPVLAIDNYPYAKNVYAAVIQLTDQIGYWPAPKADGDLYIYLTWRGLASNTVKLGFGGMGGLKERANAKPTPLGKTYGKMGAEVPVGGESPSYVGYLWSGDRKRFLEQATFGPTAALDARIRRIGLKTWLAEQFEAPYPSLNNPYPIFAQQPINPPADCDGNATVPDIFPTCLRDSYSMYPVQTWFWKEAYYGDPQLKHKVAWALSQIWVTSGADVQQSRHMVEYQKILSAGSFGNFKTMMKSVTLNAAMGGYLDMAISTKNNPNENYAREIMQLFTIGLFMLNQDGTVQCIENNPCQPGNTPIPTYTQDGVNNLTKVLTGWTFCPAATCPGNAVSGGFNYVDPMALNRNNHDLTAKTLLNYPGANPADRDIAACTGCTGTAIDTYANASLDHAIENMFQHPNVGPFISKILIQHLVTSNPTPAYVSRVAGVFNNNGLGTRGDMKAVVKAILLDPEARGDVKTDPNYGKLREPVQFVTNFGRHFGVRGAGGAGTLSDGSFGVVGQGRTNGQVNEFIGMSQLPFISPTVFNFYPPDFVIPATSLLGPEFALMTTATTVQRNNFVNRMVFNNTPIAIATPDYPNGTSFDFSDLQALSAADSSGNLLVDELDRRLLARTMPAAMKTQILNAVTAVSSGDTLGRVRQAVYLVATSAQFQVQR